MMQGLPSGKGVETIGTGRKWIGTSRNPMRKEVTSAKPVLIIPFKSGNSETIKKKYQNLKIPSIPCWIYNDFHWLLCHSVFFWAFALLALSFFFKCGSLHRFPNLNLAGVITLLASWLILVLSFILTYKWLINCTLLDLFWVIHLRLSLTRKICLLGEMGIKAHVLKVSKRNNEVWLAIYKLETFGIKKHLESGGLSLKEIKMFWVTFFFQLSSLSVMLLNQWTLHVPNNRTIKVIFEIG